jgi:hypothetical protein
MISENKITTNSPTNKIEAITGMGDLIDRPQALAKSKVVHRRAKERAILDRTKDKVPGTTE